MPTASKLVAAILLAALGYAAADRVALHLPPETPPGLLREITAFFGLWVGWKFLGPRVGGGMSSAIGLGLSAMVAMFFVAMGFFAGNEMIKRSLRKSYDDPFEALQNMVEIAIDNTKHVAYADVILVLVVGGMLVGLLVEATSRRWS
jgi:hypothetical protein